FYHGKLNEHPFQRMMTVKRMFSNLEYIQEDYIDLSFVIPKLSELQDTHRNWRNIARIRAMVKNYNQLMDVWSTRNSLDNVIKETIANHCEKEGILANGEKEILESIVLSDLMKFTQINEQAIKLTDDLLIELDDFLMNFPKTVESLLDKDRVKNLGGIFGHSASNAPELFERSPEVNYKIWGELLGYSADEMRNVNKSPYFTNS
ncbi:MAG: hypothetical protein OQJ89_10215, partial [Kangiellaceae bacterium]|nr:hypothetical protein [Kangiellaceae bacterium]